MLRSYVRLKTNATARSVAKIAALPATRCAPLGHMLSLTKIADTREPVDTFWLTSNGFDHELQFLSKISPGDLPATGICKVDASEHCQSTQRLRLRVSCSRHDCVGAGAVQFLERHD